MCGSIRMRRSDMPITMCKEMKKLRKYLTDNGIYWWDDTSISSLHWMVRTKFEFSGKEFCVLNGVGSFGGCTTHDSKNLGKLELIIDDEEPVGYLTAQEVIARMGK